jgi:hypothetical protein
MICNFSNYFWLFTFPQIARKFLTQQSTTPILDIGVFDETHLSLVEERKNVRITDNVEHRPKL